MDIETIVGWGIIVLFFVLLYFLVQFRVKERIRIQEILEKENDSKKKERDEWH